MDVTTDISVARETGVTERRARHDDRAADDGGAPHDGVQNLTKAIALFGAGLGLALLRQRRTSAAVAVLGASTLGVLAAKRIVTHTTSRSDLMEREQEDVKHVRRAITIRKSPEEVAAFWHDMGGDDDALSESVRFVPAPGGRGTEVHLDRTYERPGLIAKVIATFKHDSPSQHEFDELFALKQILETGDLVVSDAWLNGPGKMRPAQPDA